MKFRAINSNGDVIEAEYKNFCWWGFASFTDDEEADGRAHEQIFNEMILGDATEGVVIVHGQAWRWQAA